MSGTENSQPRLAGGIFIALGLLVGAIAGVVMDQPSAGMVIGLVLALLSLSLIWLLDRKRS